MIAVADTSPLNYLVLIDRIRILPRLFEHVIVPAGVIGELQHPRSPPPVAAWAAHPPEWVQVVHVSTSRMVDLSDSVASLLETNFRASPEILRHVLARRGGST